MLEDSNKSVFEALFLEMEDIEANRAGYISERQHMRILGQMRSVWVALGCLWIMTTMPLVILSILFGGILIQIIVLILGVIWLLGFVRSGVKARAQHRLVRQDLEKGEVYAIEGALIKQDRGKEGGLYLGVNELFFPVSRTLFPVATENKWVALYYLPASQQMLSLEYLPPQEEYQTI